MTHLSLGNLISRIPKRKYELRLTKLLKGNSVLALTVLEWVGGCTFIGRVQTITGTGRRGGDRDEGKKPPDNKLNKDAFAGV